MSKIVYTSYRGTYSSLLMAMLRVYQWSCLPEYNQISPISLFCQASYGELLYIGLDSQLNEIYVLGCKGLQENIKKSLLGIQKIFNLDYDELIFIDTQKLEDKIDGILMKLIDIGICKGIFKRYLYTKFREKVKRGEVYGNNL